MSVSVEYVPTLALSRQGRSLDKWRERGAGQETVWTLETPG
jgi:hypothetical protein